MIRLSRTTLLSIAVLLGITVGIGAFTFIYAEGFSYFGTNSRTCANCHIMREQFDSWQKSSHHIAATCVDCHLPKAFIPKMIAKAMNGYHHSRGFTMQDFHEPILIKPGNSRILQEACLGCHADVVHGIVAGSTTDKDAVRCVHCHASVGHGPQR